MKTKLFRFFALVLITGSLHAGQSAMHCITMYKDGKQTYIQNDCNHKVSVAYCSTNKTISRKLCGQNKASYNPYYTHMKVLDPKESDYLWNVGKIKYAACIGFINSWDPRGDFSSDENGYFSCDN
jgi:hypothetical protein